MCALLNNLAKADTKVIEDSIQTLQPKLNSEKVKILAKILKEYEKQTKTNWRIYLAILFQESSLRVDPTKCKNNIESCRDFGIGQVAYKYWGKPLKVNKHKALTDLEYSVALSIQVLENYRKKYAKKDRYWYTRYHSNTPKLRKRYLKRIISHYGKIVIAERNFRRNRYYVQEENHR
jgi:hypothetical protein